MKNKKKIQIFYGGFKFVKGGVNSHSISLKQEFEKFYDVSLITLDDLSIIFRFIPHLIEKIVNFFFLPLGFFYKGICTKILFKFFFDRNCDYRIFEDIYISWNSNIPSLTMLHAVWSDNLQKYKLEKKVINKLKLKEINKINKINHPVGIVSEPYKNFILNKHFSKKIKKNFSVIELGIKEKCIIKKKKEKKKSLIYVGSLESRKNVFFLLKLFKKIHKFDSDYRLTIIGDGPDKKKLLLFVKKNYLPVKFLGNKDQNEIFKELSNHEIYIHTSTKESFSLSLLEAKISGLITVAFKNLEVPKEFIDIGLEDFRINRWFNKIISKNKINKKIDENKYLIKNTAKKLINKSAKFDVLNQSFFKNLSAKKIHKVKKKYNLKDNFILTIGHGKREKNYLCLFRAIQILKNENTNIRLIIVIKDTKEQQYIQKLINNLNLNMNIKIIVNINHFELACFYKSAKLFVSTPFNEDFTAPIYECMASSLPMILENNNSFRKLTKNKFVYFDQYDPLSIANKIKFVLSNKEIRKELINFGKKKVNFFATNEKNDIKK